MNEIEQQAFVLHHRPYRDNQLLVELLTEQNGKVSALVFVGQSKKSIKKGLLQPFYPLTVVLKGQGNLKHIVRVEAFEKSYPLRKNRLYCGFYLNELLVRLLGEHIQCQSLFFQYKASLEALVNDAPMMAELRKFELVLLEELGMSFDFSPVFESTANHFYYLPDEGFIPALMNLKAPCYNRLHLQSIAKKTTNHQWVNEDSSTYLIERDLTRDDLAETDLTQNELAIQQTFKNLMRQIFAHLLNNKPLNARKLFRSNH